MTTTVPPETASGEKKSNALATATSVVKEYGIILALVVIIGFFQVVTQGRLLQPNNVTSLVQQNAYVFILAVGMLMIIVAGHIDLSVGSVVAAVGGVLGVLMTDFHVNPWLAIVVALVVGGIIGAWQGFWVAYVGVPAFIVTLGGMLIFRGVALVLVGYTRAGFDADFLAISNDGVAGTAGFLGSLDAFTLVVGAVGIAWIVISTVLRRVRAQRRGLVVESLGLMVARLVVLAVLLGLATYWIALSALGLPYVLVIVGVVVIAYAWVMGNTVFGRHIYAVGGNLAAAKLSGINTRKVNFWLFVNMGWLCGLAAVVVTSRAGAAVAAAGNNYELDAIAACFIGGAAVTGGIGRVPGAIIGALIMGVLNMGLSIMGVDPSWQSIIKGLVLIAAVAFDMINKARTKGA
ncbi:multiple monosaccharide ABC transporter permease [Propioniciclava flava]|jgi:putative multiple sugar transport system permease protein|uniref:Xylose transport system permease protein XylH n=1 Tax=Propioniciclava flava TaxID=2072026 RepID=A0A4Q2EDU5_9ACTN|nr:multiple monosaccharide ABC transporter permease [Propioniciclava flava]RXW31339.1 sugar ABC transporter permease [Propioniciclava flava]